MLKLARKRNPGIIYKQGDMRNFNLNKKFDVVISFDAMIHNLNYKDLKSTLNCLSNHLDEGGTLIFYLDKLKESFKQYGIVEFSQHFKNNTHLTFLEINYDKNPKDDIFENDLIFLIAKKGKELEVKTDKIEMGLFELFKIKEILSGLGFKVYLYSGDFSGKKYSKKSPFPVFVCVK